jgi:hypothetical protein
MKNFLIKIVSATAVLFSVAAGFSAQQEQRLALLIGNGNYLHGGSLGNPINDVRAMKRALEGLGFTVTTYEDCSQKTMKRAMDAFGRKLKGKDVGLFFYAGHGVQVNGHNYLIPVDAKLDGENDAEYDCVRADRVLAKMETAGSKTNTKGQGCREIQERKKWVKNKTYFSIFDFRTSFTIPAAANKTSSDKMTSRSAESLFPQLHPPELRTERPFSETTFS